MRIYGQISKVTKNDDGTLTVEGIASSDCVDVQGETITADAMKNALPDFFKYGTGNLREMHENIAAGVVESASVEDDGKTYIVTKVVDPIAVKKVETGVYKGFSIGGSKLKGGYDPVTKTISALRLSEISLVDRPANPESVITMWKSDSVQDDEVEKAIVEISSYDPEGFSKMLDDPDVLERLIKAISQKKDEDHQSDITKTFTSPELQTLIANAIADGIAKGLQAAQVVKTDVAEEVVERKETELKKGFKALAATGDDIAKGMYSVSRFADILQSLCYLQSDAAYEAAYEQDGSTLPAQLADLVTQTGNVLLQMANEEVGELITAMKMPDGTPAVEILNAAIANSAYAGDLKKSAELTDIIKAGSRNSAKDQESLQKAHDLLTGLGAACTKDDDTEEMDKHDHVHDHSKIEKMAGELGTLRKSYDSLTKEHADLKKKFDDMPTVPKAVLKVVGKTDDATDLNQTPMSVDPVHKSDGTVDDVATQIKQIHSSGGRSLNR